MSSLIFLRKKNLRLARQELIFSYSKLTNDMFFFLSNLGNIGIIWLFCVNEFFFNT